MAGPLTDLLRHVVAGEPAPPAVDDEVDEIFRRADLLRRRRARMLAGGGSAGVFALIAAGYLLISGVVPDSRPAGRVAAPEATADAVAGPSGGVSASAGSVPADPVLAVLAPVAAEKNMTIVPRPPERGNGWRQYAVRDGDGTDRGTVEVAIYQVAEDLCFPVLASKGSCAHTEWAPKGVEFVRYDDESDRDHQTHETMARRITDGRTVAVMATGERDVGAKKGKPGLTGKQVERVATDQALFDAFGPDERCTGSSADTCPEFRVPVPTDE